MRKSDILNSVWKADNEEEIREVFDLLDHSRSGVLSTNELMQMLATVESFGRSSTLYKLLGKKMKNKEYTLSFEEFKNIILKKLNKGKSSEDYEKLFELYDIHGSGITFNDLKTIAKEIGEDVDSSDLRRMIAYADKNSDAVVSKEEFIAFMSAPFRWGKSLNINKDQGNDESSKSSFSETVRPKTQTSSRSKFDLAPS